MTRVVWKFRLNYVGVCEVRMPSGAEVIHVGEHEQAVCLWAVVCPGSPTELRQFLLAATGHDLSDAGKHLGTAHLEPLTRVFHVFEMPGAAQ